MIRGKRGVLCLLMTVCLILGLCAPGAGVFAAEDEEKTVHIRTAEELQNFAKKCVLDAASAGITVILDEDIDVSGTGFMPFQVFSGTFDGKHHTISGLKLAGGYMQGLFRLVAPDGIVRDLYVKGNIDDAACKESLGGIVGTNFGTLIGLDFSGFVHGKQKVGGIAGENRGTIRSCTNEGEILGKTNTGGIAGYNTGVIIACKNLGDVNTRLETSALSLDDLSINALTDGDLVSASDVDVVSGTGGIAGCSDGTVKNSVNHGRVGYQHFGYNTGGIIGIQSGYVEQCTNYGTVFGKKDIGGIIGQMSPYMILVESESLLDEIEAFSDAVDKAMDNLDSNSEKTSRAFDNVKKKTSAAKDDAIEYNNTSDDPISLDDVIETEEEKEEKRQKARDILKKIEEEGTDIYEEVGEDAVERIINGEGTDEDYEKLAEIGGEDGKILLEESAARIAAKKAAEAARKAANDAALDNLQTDATSIADGLRILNQSLSGTTSQLADDLQDVNTHYEKMMSLIANLASGNGNIMTDISDQATKEDITGRVSDSRNKGAVSGDTNVGGIAGEMGMEIEEDMNGTLTSEFSARELITRTYEYRCISNHNINEGTVTGKKNHIGGIIGSAELGSIIGCEGYGSVSSEDGERIGGITGYSAATVRKCYAMCRLTGKSFVGGISGYGYKILGCISLVNINEDAVEKGTVAGWADYSYATEAEDVNISGNFYVHETLGAINGISYTAIAEPIAYEELLAVEDLPERFKTLKLTFVAEGKTVREISFTYGAGIDKSVLPEVPVKNGFTGHWPDYDYSRLYFSDTIEAVYVSHQETLEADRVREGSQKPVALIEGSFGSKSSVTLLSYKGTLPEITEGTILESWVLNINDNSAALDEYTIHYLKPELLKNSDAVEILVKNGDKWEAVPVKQSGSYLLFKAKDAEVIFTAAEIAGNGILPVLIICGAILVLLVLGFVFRKKLIETFYGIVKKMKKADRAEKG